MGNTELYDHYHKYTSSKISLHFNILLSHTMQVQSQAQALARRGTQVKGARVQITMVSMLEIIRMVIIC